MEPSKTLKPGVSSGGMMSPDTKVPIDFIPQRFLDLPLEALGNFVSDFETKSWI